MPISPTKRVAAAVRIEMQTQQLTQAHLATALRISQQSVSRRLSGETPFNVDELAIIADLLAVDAAVLLLGAA